MQAISRQAYKQATFPHNGSRRARNHGLPRLRKDRHGRPPAGLGWPKPSIGIPGAATGGICSGRRGYASHGPAGDGCQTLAPAKPRRRQRRLGSAMDYLLQTTPAAKISSVRQHEMAPREEETAPKDRSRRETAREERIRAMRTTRNFTRIERVFPKP